MGKIEKAALLEGYLPTEDVELPSGRGSVTIRGLTRHEAVEVQRGVKDDDPDAPAILECRALAAGMLDPTLTVDEAEQWRRSGLAADVAAVAKRISELSSLDERAGKGPTSSSRRTRG